MVLEKNEKEKEMEIADELNFIDKMLDSFDDRSDNFESAELLINLCIPKLKIIKDVMGKENQTYLRTSTQVAKTASYNVGIVFNTMVDRYRADKSLFQEHLKMVFKSNNLLDLISTMDIEDQFLIQLNEQKRLNNDVKDYYEKNGNPNNSGCYIATMAYGDYNHPQVKVLRRFRDNFLSKSYLGQKFITTYYYFSPKIVNLLKGAKLINGTIRFCLDLFIKLLYSIFRVK